MEGEQEKPAVCVLGVWEVLADTSKAPEVRRLQLRGRRGTWTITTECLERKVGPLTYETTSGTLYRLDGPPAPAYAAWCKKMGIDLDLADPVKFREDAESLKWQPTVGQITADLTAALHRRGSR
jgi:hypothetical protein